MGHEPSIEPSRPSAATRNQKPDPVLRTTVLPPTPNIHEDEPFTIDTSHYNTSRVVINPGTPTEPTYELEKKGHTSVIRVSYPGPETVQSVPEPSPPSFQRPMRDSPSSVHRGPSSVHRGPSLPLRSDSAMGLESFHFVAVLGRGHFGKVTFFILNSFTRHFNRHLEHSVIDDLNNKNKILNPRFCVCFHLNKIKIIHPLVHHLL